MLIVLIILQIGLGKMFYKHSVEIIFVWLATLFLKLLNICFKLPFHGNNSQVNHLTFHHHILY